jgi:hypothetical protein
MKKIDIGQIASVIANLGVIASVVFLGLELRTIKNQASISTTQEMVDQLTGWEMGVAVDSDALETYARGLANFESLDDVEKTRFDLLMRVLLERVESARAARDSSLVETLAETYEKRGIEGRVLRIAGNPGFQSWWKQADRRGLPPTVVPLIDELVKLGSH